MARDEITEPREPLKERAIQVVKDVALFMIALLIMVTIMMAVLVLVDYFSRKFGLK